MLIKKRHILMRTAVLYIYIYIYTTLPFLDVSVQIAQKTIFATLHKNPTDNHNYLHNTSCYTVHIKESLIYCQFLRFKRICTRNTDYVDHSKELTTHLLNEACPINVIIKQWNKVTKIQRTRHQQTSYCLPLVQTYHPTIVPTNKSVVKEWKRN